MHILVKVNNSSQIYIETEFTENRQKKTLDFERIEGNSWWR